MTLTSELTTQLTAWRRDFHRFAETGWTEFRTTSAIITVLRDLGWDTVYGPELHDPDARLGVPSAEVLAVERERAVAQGADPELVAAMGDGFTGVLGVLETGRPGPVVCFRFDIDSNDLIELADDSHRPFAEGFASVNDGAMHGCGHDGHAAIGLGLATSLTRAQDELTGTVKIIFQPAEEGVRGAHSIVAAGWFDDVDLFVATHLKSDDEKGNVLTGSDGYLASTKLDATFSGVGAHAGGDPERGKNALLAAASATLNLHAIPRHSAGASRINVGTFHAGEGRNVVPRAASLRLETRGETSSINSYVEDRARDVIAGAARMYDIDASVTVVGKADQESPSPKLLPYIRTCFEGVDGVAEIHDSGGLGGSEDATAMMKRVKERGGLATYVQIGMDTSWGHHTERFDVDEDMLAVGVVAEAKIALGAGAFLAGEGDENRVR
ncbi:amidohydrolase [Brevibacterium aurantiacum]|uniref:Amidohydrolase n=2 Tax=Brevibacterium aurantiacum TaxID=273384 RepID=A0A1D7W2D0_BREAU|nr:amidohydrolase [Brevibacterium aurantiacum]MDN5592748.1 amidohydrolase [Brevibacterium sp.]AOP53155.1 Putative aminohydrolase [Brevibacterium aurantiacum]AZL05394.1 amidohydrolase [Brevibacterium aurantiacum]AZL12590.1 amidohydrolase [Brevibacterium aurantiacum]AZT96849.1 amidohydrolase [Brevibacterium aurantiacum]